MSSIPFTLGQELGDVPQTEEDKEFALADLESGLKGGIYERVSPEYEQRKRKEGHMISSAFTVWSGEGEKRKGRFVINLHQQSQHWRRGSVRMETLPSFALELQEGDRLMSWDVKSGYRHMYLHPDMRDFFIFRYAGCYYRCIALPFGWGRSALWFTKMMRPIVRFLRQRWRYRILPYLDDFLLAPSPPGTIASASDCKTARARLSKLFSDLGITRHPTKGCWKGSTTLEHLGMLLDTSQMRVFVTEEKMARVRTLAKRILAISTRNARLVPFDMLRSFCGVCVSLTLAVPLARFYTRAMFTDLSIETKRGEERGQSSQRARRACESWRAENFTRRRRARERSAYKDSPSGTSSTGALSHAGRGETSTEYRRISRCTPTQRMSGTAAPWV